MRLSSVGLGRRYADHAVYPDQCCYFGSADLPARRMADRQDCEITDSYRAQITINILCTVFLMSIFLTVIGSWIGARQITTEPVRLFFYKWPRSFSISFVVEALVAQMLICPSDSFLHQKKGFRLAV